MSQMICPVCRTQFDRQHSASLPFCCARCRQIDLGRWLGEQYSMPNRALDELDEEDLGSPRRADDED